MSSTDSTLGTESSRVAFQFVQALAAELSHGSVEIPGFPSIVSRVRQVLADESASADKVARVVGADPVLAARLLKLANSAAMLGSSRPATDLRTAVSRVGLNAVRSTTHAHAVRILGQSETLRGLEKPLEALARQTAQVASLCHVIAGKYTRLQPDAAMLAGLLHSSGRLYLLTRASSHRSLFTNANVFRAVEREWHLSVAVALLENWDVPEPIVHCVSESEDVTREPRGAPSLSDVLMLALAITRNAGQPELLETQLREVPSLARFKLNAAVVADMLEESKGELAQLEAALT